jgi:hypothetical protein
MKVSLNRQQVDQALAARGTDLPTYLDLGRRRGQSIEDIAAELRIVTGVPFTSRTLYRWADKLEVSV